MLVETVSCPESVWEQHSSPHAHRNLSQRMQKSQITSKLLIIFSESVLFWHSGCTGVLWPAEGALRRPELLCVTYAYCLSINVRSGLPNGVGRGSISLKRLQSDPFSAPRVPAVCAADDCLSPRHLWCGLAPGLCVSMPPNP